MKLKFKMDLVRILHNFAMVTGLRDGSFWHDYKESQLFYYSLKQNSYTFIMFISIPGHRYAHYKRYNITTIAIPTAEQKSGKEGKLTRISIFQNGSG